ncbi:MAG: gluconolactonase [Cyanobium sp. NAT70]|nr:gluconolactonase [Cyanobium sp. NAT70]|tara:strand:- start:1071 stop:2012 length:942 start_codon:yes stop_codon:yes gene_type:complete
MSVPASRFLETRYDVVDPAFNQLILFNAQLECLFEGGRWLEGPVWFGDQQRLLFSDIPSDRILSWTEQDGVTLFRGNAGYPNGQTRDRYGRLLTCSHGRRALLRTEHSGEVVELVESHRGKPLNTPNDVIVKSDHTVWFTDPLYGLVNDYEGGRRKSEQVPTVYRYDPADGSLQAMTDSIAGPNGLAFSPDESLLYVVETSDPNDLDPDRSIQVFDVKEGGRRLVNQRLFARVHPGNADGIRVDQMGHVWSSAGDGVHCLAPDGSLLGRILTSKVVGNICFGGAFANRLFLCSWDSVLSIFVNTRGCQHSSLL